MGSRFHLNLYAEDTCGIGDTQFMVSGSADNQMKLWQISTGKCLFTWEFPTAVKRVAFNEEGTQIICITEQRMGHQSAVRIFAVNREDGSQRQYFRFLDQARPNLSAEDEESISLFNPIGSKPTVVSFGHTSDFILTGHESGKVTLYDAKSGEELDSVAKAHMDTVTDMQLSKDRSYFITSSKDKTAKVRLWCRSEHSIEHCSSYLTPKPSIS